MRVLVDTNVYLEFFLKREKYEEAYSFFSLAIEKRHQTYITSMTLRDIGYVIKRKTHSSKMAKLIQSKTYSMVSKVASVSNDAAIEALYSDIQDFEDAMQSYAAEEAMCDAIISFNKKDYLHSRIPVFTPEEINTIWKSL